ncbi:MAG: DUF6717 family protein [Geitlerinemataceae cyanobacterium]
MANAMMAIFPYLDDGTWMFDDAAKDLVREPFVFGIPPMIEALTADIDDAESGFRLIFSSSPFPNHQMQLTRLREEFGGHWYRLAEGQEGWLCPALFKYFDEAPEEIYVMAETKR